jgi:hypothetical protein
LSRFAIFSIKHTIHLSLFYKFFSPSWHFISFLYIAFLAEVMIIYDFSTLSCNRNRCSICHNYLPERIFSNIAILTIFFFIHATNKSEMRERKFFIFLFLAFSSFDFVKMIFCSFSCATQHGKRPEMLLWEESIHNWKNKLNKRYTRQAKQQYVMWRTR